MGAEVHVGRIIASCGCTLQDEDGQFISTKDEMIDHDLGRIVNCVRSGLYCSKCADELRTAGLILTTEEEEDAWLDGNRPLPSPKGESGE